MPEPFVSLNEESLNAELREIVRKTVEEMLNGLLDEEADDLVGAERYERTADREAYRAGHYERKLTTTSDEVTIRMSKLRGVRFATTIIASCRRSETSVEDVSTNCEACLANVDELSGIECVFVIIRAVFRRYKRGRQSQLSVLSVIDIL